MKTIVVPGYVADEFNAPLRHPNPHADAVRKSIDRVYGLIDTALAGIENPNWRVGSTCYGSKVNIEPYGFEWVGYEFYIYASERGGKFAMAISKVVTLLRNTLYGSFLVEVVPLTGLSSLKWSRNFTAPAAPR